jgi:5'-phosphate synthase pdxT subunit
LVAGGAGSPLGVLALQGDVREHVAALTEVGVASRLVKRVGDLDGLAGCVLPGGESTTLSMLLESTGLWDPLGALIEDGLPVLGTCAGLVLLAREVLDGRPDQRSFGALDVVVRRNGFGRQLQSFEAVVDVGNRLGGPVGRDGASPGGAPPLAPPLPLPAVFIRAPMVVKSNPQVEVLGWLHREASGYGEAVEIEEMDGNAGKGGSTPVIVRQGNVLASVFHPELTPDRRIHRLFVEMCGG